MIRKVAIYCRVSTIEQVNEGYSIEEQERRLKAFCDINGWEKYEVFVDPGVSGGTLNRPALQDMRDRIKEFDLVLVYKLDRLTRNVRDLLGLLDTFEENNVAFRSATEVYDTSSAMGRLFVTLVGAMAEWERSTIAERTAMGKQSAFKKGMNVTKVPFYYDKVDGQLVPNEYAEALHYMVRRIKEGAGTSTIADELNSSEYKHPNGKNWYSMQIRRALKSPQARGHSVYNDEVIKDTHEALISNEDYSIIQDMLRQRTNVGTSNHTSIFRGKFKCHVCGVNLTLSVHHKKTKTQGVKTYRTYYCDKCKANKEPKENKITFSLERAEQAFLNYLKFTEFDDYGKQEEQESTPVIDVKKVEKQRQKYQEAWSMDLMTDDEFFARMEDTKKVLNEYYKQVEAQEHQKIKSPEELKNIKELVLRNWHKLTEEQKEEMVYSTVKEIKYSFEKGTSYKNPNIIEVTGVIFY